MDKAVSASGAFNAVSIGAQNRHLDSYIEWLGRQYYQYRCECMKYEKQRGDILASADASAGLLGISPQAKETSRHYQNELDVLHKNWGWLDDVHDAAIRMKNSMENNPNDKRIQIVPDIYRPALRRARRFLDYAQRIQCRTGINALIPDNGPRLLADISSLFMFVKETACQRRRFTRAAVSVRIDLHPQAGV